MEHETPLRTSPRRPRSRATAIVFITFVALSSTRCVQDLVSPPDALVPVLELPQGEIRLAVGDTVGLDTSLIKPRVMLGGQQIANVRIVWSALGSTSAVDDAGGRLAVTRLGRTLVEIRALSIGLPNELVDTIAIVPFVHTLVATVAAADTPLVSLGQPLALRAEARSRSGVSLPAIRPQLSLTWTVDSGAAVTVRPGDSTATAVSNGAARIRATVPEGDTATLTVRVDQVPAKLSPKAAPPASAQSGVVFSVQPAIEVRDARDSAVRKSGLLVQAAILTGTPGATLADSSAQTSATGVATFTGMAITGTVGPFVLRFSLPASPGVAPLDAPALSLAPGLPSAAKSTITVSATTVASGSLVTLIFQAKDAADNALTTGGATVVFTRSGGTSTGTIGPTADSGNGTYTASFTGVLSGTATTIGATVNGLATTSTVAVTVGVGAISPATSVVSVSAASATSGSSVTLTLRARDAAGNALTTGGATVVFTRSGGTSTGTIGTTADSGNGTYTASFTGVLSGTATTIGATINAAAVVSTAPLTVMPGAISPATSVVSVSAASVASGSSATLTLRARDAAGNALTTGGATVVFTRSGGTSTGTIGPTGDSGNGTYTASFTGVLSGTATTIGATINAAAVVSAASLTVMPGAISPATSVVSVSAASVASGSSATLTLQGRDAAGNTLTTGGATVVFTRLGGTSTGTIGPTTDNGNGTYTASFTGVLSGTATTIGATISGAPVTSTLPALAVTTSWWNDTLTFDAGTLPTGWGSAAFQISGGPQGFFNNRIEAHPTSGAFEVGAAGSLPAGTTAVVAQFDFSAVSTSSGMGAGIEVTTTSGTYRPAITVQADGSLPLRFVQVGDQSGTFNGLGGPLAGSGTLFPSNADDLGMGTGFADYRLFFELKNDSVRQVLQRLSDGVVVEDRRYALPNLRLANITGMYVLVTTTSATVWVDNVKFSAGALALPSRFVDITADTIQTAPGGTRQLSVTVRDVNGNVVSSPTVTYASVNSTVAGVSATGVVRAITADSVRVIASSGGFADTVRVLGLPSAFSQVCDPARSAFSDAFPGTTLDPAWTSLSGSWTVSGGSVTSANTAARLLLDSTLYDRDNFTAVVTVDATRKHVALLLQKGGGGYYFVQFIRENGVAGAEAGDVYFGRSTSPFNPANIDRRPELFTGTRVGALDTIGIRKTGSLIEGYINRRKVFEYVDTSFAGAVRIGLYAEASPVMDDFAVCNVYRAASISLSSSSIAPALGDTTRLSATVKDSTGATLTGRRVRFSTSNAAVATVDSVSGLVTATGAGSATVTASVEGLSASAAVTVTGWQQLSNHAAGTGYAFSGMAASNGYLVSLGSSGGCNTIRSYTAAINADGTLGSWVRQADYPSTGAVSGTAVYNGFTYGVAGHDGCSWYTSAVGEAPVGSGGTVSSWTATTSFPRFQTHNGVVARGGYLYAIGGLDVNCPGSARSNVTFAPINANGSVGAWSETTALPAARERSGALVTSDGRIFVLGGNSSGCASPTNTIYIGQQNANGTISSWASAGTLPVAGTVFYNNVFLLDGSTVLVALFTGSTTTLYRGTITGNSIGGWLDLGTMSSNQYVLALSGNYLYATGDASTAAVYRLRLK